MWRYSGSAQQAWNGTVQWRRSADCTLLFLCTRRISGRKYEPNSNFSGACHHLEDSKKFPCQLLNARCETTLYMVKICLLKHLVEFMQRLESLWVVSDASFRSCNVYVKRAYWFTLKRHSSGKKEEVRVIKEQRPPESRHSGENESEATSLYWQTEVSYKRSILIDYKRSNHRTTLYVWRLENRTFLWASWGC